MTVWTVYTAIHPRTGREAGYRTSAGWPDVAVVADWHVDPDGELTVGSYDGWTVGDRHFEDGTACSERVPLQIDVAVVEFGSASPPDMIDPDLLNLVDEVTNYDPRPDPELEPDLPPCRCGWTHLTAPKLGERTNDRC